MASAAILHSLVTIEVDGLTIQAPMAFIVAISDDGVASCLCKHPTDERLDVPYDVPAGVLQGFFNAMLSVGLSQTPPTDQSAHCPTRRSVPALPVREDSRAPQAPSR
jgi:hypothetical protein